MVEREDALESGVALGTTLRARAGPFCETAGDGERSVDWVESTVGLTADAGAGAGGGGISSDITVDAAAGGGSIDAMVGLCAILFFVTTKRSSFAFSVLP